MSFPSFLFRQKYRLDLGQQSMGLLNFTLLLIATSEKIKAFLGIEKTWVFVVTAVVSGYFGVWFIGFFLDRVMRYGEHASDIAVKRSPHTIEIMNRLRHIEKMLKERP